MEQAPKILVVDDSPVSRTLVQRTLGRGKFDVLLAATGQEAFDLYNEHHPGVVVTDWMMPDLSGIELCRRIRESEQDSYAYLIVVTGLTQKEKLVEALDAGADDYVTKPFHPDELLARVNVGCRIARLQKDLAEKNTWLEQLSLTDPLTGIPNRRAVEEWAERELRAARRHQYPVSVVLADVDRFKQVNDTYGHAAGDSVLKDFAQILREHTRRSDLVGRIGGEEFVMVLPHSTAEESHLVTERIRLALAAQSFEDAGRSFSVTASFGICEFAPEMPVPFAALLQIADKALYEAKNSGRNRIEIRCPTVEMEANPA